MISSNAKQARNWIVDALLFTGYLASMVLDLTGVIAHEFLGAALIALGGYHLLAHGRWVSCATSRFLGNLGAQCRRIYVVDAALLAGFVALGVTGLAISTWLALPLSDYVAWRDVHVYSSLAALALVVVKVGLHWRWIATVAARDVFRPRLAVPRLPAPQRVRVGTRVSRRDFVRVMGIASAASLAVGARVLAQTDAVPVEANSATPDAAAPASVETPASALAVSVEGPTAPATSTASLNASAPAVSTALAVSAAPTATAQKATVTPVSVAVVSPASSTAACSVRCARHCSYPGQCRRYVDSNRNGLCDLGECTA